MAALDVCAVKAGLFGQKRGLHILFGERVEVFIGDDGRVGSKAHARVEQRIVLRHERSALVALRPGVPAGMRQLNDVQRPVIRAVCGRGGRVGFFQQFGKFADILFGEHHLQRVCAALPHNGAGLPPQQPGPTSGKPGIPALYQLARRAVRLGIAALHGQHRNCVRRGFSADLHRM